MHVWSFSISFSELRIHKRHPQVPTKVDFPPSIPTKVDFQVPTEVDFWAD